MEALLAELGGLTANLGDDETGTAAALDCVMERLRASEARLERLTRGETRTWPRQSVST
jgi:hypothetical protein